MPWSFKLFEIAGTQVRAHLTFFVLLAVLGSWSYYQGGIDAAVERVVFVILLFGCVVLHEFGHALAALRYGVRTPDITILPIGGLARLESMPEKPGEEAVVAIAGPIVNVIIAILLGAYLYLSSGMQTAVDFESVVASLPGQLLLANIALVVFNLVPAFPMDGGRLLRAFLTSQIGYVRATQIAATLGQGLAIAFAVLAIFAGPLLFLVAVFVFLAAANEKQAAAIRDFAARRTVRDVMITNLEPLSLDSSIGDALQLLSRSTQDVVPVLDHDQQLCGFVSRRDLERAFKRDGPARPISDMVEADIPSVASDAELKQVVDLLQTSEKHIVAITDRFRRFQGYIALKHVARLAAL
ncbi:MAG: site-2 protease family protein [Pseudomonadota bacterium]